MKRLHCPSLRPYFWQILLLIPLAIIVHYCKESYVNRNFRYNLQTNIQVVEAPENQCKRLVYDVLHLRKDVNELNEKLAELTLWKDEFTKNFDQKIADEFDKFYTDQIGLIDYAADYSGGSIISTPDTVPYPSIFSIRIMGGLEWVLDSEPRLLLQHNNFPGKCYAFYGRKGRIQIKLSRPVLITHVSLEHTRIEGKTKSAPKDFQVLGLGDDGVENLGHFHYDLGRPIIQTFMVDCKNRSFQKVELRISDNHGDDELTCVYRFRVHSLV